MKVIDRAITLDAAKATTPFRFQFVSDVHTEMYNAAHKCPHIPALSPTLVLAGDIGCPTSSVYREYISELAKRFEDVVLVAGNHEYYSARSMLPHDHVPEAIRHAVAQSPNVHFLQKESVAIKGVRFLGCTLWTRLEGNDLHEMGARMNDYSKIYLDKQHRASPLDTNGWHNDQASWLANEIGASDTPTVVVTHHCPHPNFVGKSKGSAVEHAYYTPLEDEYFRRPVVTWIAGHTHVAASFMHNGVLLASNCRGYPREVVLGYNASRIITL